MRTHISDASTWCVEYLFSLMSDVISASKVGKTIFHLGSAIQVKRCCLVAAVDLSRQTLLTSVTWLTYVELSRFIVPFKRSGDPV